MLVVQGFLPEPNQLDAGPDGLLGQSKCRCSRCFLRPCDGIGKTLLRIPFREVWLSVALLLVVGENYPFSDFPMYSSLEEESVYFAVRTGRDETLAFATSFRSRASFVPKALKAERRKARKGWH